MFDVKRLTTSSTAAGCREVLLSFYSHSAAFLVWIERCFLPATVPHHPGAVIARPAGAGSTEPRQGDRFYRPELDGLRFLAFFAVFIHHALGQDPPVRWQHRGFSPDMASWVATTLTGGGYGVDLFFCLSAYLITELLVREHERFGSVNAWRFWTRRALRIWPLYYAFVIFAALPILNHALSGREFVAFALFFANWQIAFHGYPISVAAPLWSVAIEEQFYLVWPWVVRLLSPARIRSLCLGMLALALATRALLVAGGVHHPGIWCNTFARLDPIALGALLAIVLRGRAPDLSRAARWALIAAALGTIVLVAHFVPVDAPVLGYAQVWSYLAVGLACAAILLATITDIPGLLGRQVPVFLGRISYGLYVVHALGLKLAGNVVSHSYGSRQPLLKFVLGFGITLALATASYYALERPFLRMKARFAAIQSRPD
jgi:peptidoglycan/LPS O-acetylase OafA/YrhL